MSTSKIMIRAILAREAAHAAMAALLEAGFFAVTKLEVFRQAQHGTRAGTTPHDEIVKEMLVTVVPVADKARALRTIVESARSRQNGAYGHGSIFITPAQAVEAIHTDRRAS